MRPDEEKEVAASFPEDYGYRKWAGKTISFHVKIKDIKEKILPPLDDEFATDLNYASLDELKIQLRQDMVREKEALVQRQLKDQIEETLLQANSFEVPESLVEGQVRAFVSDTKGRLAAQGASVKDLGISEEKLEKDYRGTAEKRVKAFLIIEKIAEQEGISVTEERCGTSTPGDRRAVSSEI